MKILAAGVRYDENKVIQSVVVVTDENGGHPNHIHPHKHHAAKLGHGWLDIDPEIYSKFEHRDHLEAHFAEAVK